MEVADAIGLLLTPEGRDDPYPTYAALRGHGPLAKMQDGFFVATGYAAIDEIMRDPRMRVTDGQFLERVAPEWEPGRAARSIGRSMLQTNPPDHTRMRRVAAGAFTARRVAAMRETIAAQADTLASHLQHLGRTESSVDFMTEFAYPLPIRVICALLGVPAADQHWFREKAAALTVVLEPQLGVVEFDEADRAVGELEAYFTDLAGRRRREPRDDLTTALTEAMEGDELLANLILLLVAGFETTTNLLGNGLMVLFGEPASAARLRDDPSLATGYVEELLRFDSPVQLTTRWSPEPVSFAGVEVEPYSEILMLLGSGNRDPGRFTDPDRFDPMRESNQPLSFGAGAHHCLGAALARLEAQVAFPLLLARFPALALAGQPVRRDRLTLRGYGRLPVTL